MKTVLIDPLPSLREMRDNLLEHRIVAVNCMPLALTDYEIELITERLTAMIIDLEDAE